MRLVADHHAAAFHAVAALRISRSSPRVSAVEHLTMCESTKKFFAMFALHMCSGRPVEADCCERTRRATACRRPCGSVAFRYSSPAFLTSSISSSIGISRSAARACGALRMSRCNRPAVGLADLGDRLAGAEVQDLVGLERLVGLAPAQDGNVEHERRSSVVGLPREFGCGAMVCVPGLCRVPSY